MKQIIILGLLMILSFSACSLSNENAETESLKTVKVNDEKTIPDRGKTPVLVELFTSEGCSSCPPADRILARLQKEQPVADAEIITLAFHVDYWDYLGWKDAFSSAGYSQRQNDYTNTFGSNSNYTPQMIVDGKAEFVGSRFSTAVAEISRATEKNKANADISVETNNTDVNLKIKISDLNVIREADIWLAIAEDNLATDVKRGENGGRQLAHASVVRDLLQIGKIGSNDRNFEADKTVQLNSVWKTKDLSFVVFVQDKNSKQIFALGKTHPE